MNFFSLIAPRIVEERKRLELSQDAAARACGVSREMWGKYERDKATMGTEVLSAYGAAGADVLYILTGIRLTQRQRQLMENALRVTIQADLSREDRERQLALLGKAAQEVGAVNAARAERYALLVELLNDCTDSTLILVEQMVQRLRLADVQRR